MDAHQMRLFEFKLEEIYNRTEWLQHELPLQDFISRFVIEYKDDVPQRPEMPEEPELDRDTKLAVLVAFREAFS